MSRAGPGAIPGRITPWSAVDQVGQQPLVAGRQIAPPLVEHSGEAIELSHVVGTRGGAVVVGKGRQPPPIAVICRSIARIATSRCRCPSQSALPMGSPAMACTPSWARETLRRHIAAERQELGGRFEPYPFQVLVVPLVRWRWRGWSAEAGHGVGRTTRKPRPNGGSLHREHDRRQHDRHHRRCPFRMTRVVAPARSHP